MLFLRNHYRSLNIPMKYGSCNVCALIFFSISHSCNFNCIYIWELVITDYYFEYVSVAIKMGKFIMWFNLVIYQVYFTLLCFWQIIFISKLEKTVIPNDYFVSIPNSQSLLSCHEYFPNSMITSITDFPCPLFQIWHLHLHHQADPRRCCSHGRQATDHRCHSVRQWCERCQCSPRNSRRSTQTRWQHCTLGGSNILYCI